MKVLNSKGITLAEVIITLGISIIAGTLLISLFVQNSGVFNNQQAKVTQGLSLNDAISTIGEDIRSASGIAASYPSASPTYTTNSSTLVLQIPSIDSSGNVIESTFDNIVIVRDAAKPKILKELIFPNASSVRKSVNRVIANDVSSVIFLYYDSNKAVVTPTQASIIDYTINLTTSVGVNSQQASQSGQSVLRNN